MNSRFSDMFKAFQFVDLDRSGTLDEKEISRALDLWNIPISPDKLKSLIKSCDHDGDGQVDYKEFVDVLARDTVAPAAMGKRGMQAKEAMGVDGRPDMGPKTEQRRFTPSISSRAMQSSTPPQFHLPSSPTTPMELPRVMTPLKSPAHAPAPAASSRRTVTPSRLAHKLADRTSMRYKDIGQAFHAIDTSGDQQVSHKELLKVMTAWNLSCTMQEVRALANTLCAVTAFLSCYHTRHSPPSCRGNSILTTCPSPIPLRQVDALMEEMDSNSDGKVDLGEFQRGMAKLRRQGAALGHGAMEFGGNDSSILTGKQVLADGTVLINDNFASSAPHQIGLRPAVIHDPLPETTVRATQAEMDGYVNILRDKVDTKYKTMQRMFRAMDEDKSGFLSKEELVNAIQHFNLPFPLNHVIQTVDEMLDTNHDGQLSYDEFCSVLRTADHHHHSILAASKLGRPLSRSVSVVTGVS